MCVSVCKYAAAFDRIERMFFGVLRLWNDILWKTAGGIKNGAGRVGVKRNNVEKVIGASRCFTPAIKRTVIFITFQQTYSSARSFEYWNNFSVQPTPVCVCVLSFHVSRHIPTYRHFAF